MTFTKIICCAILVFVPVLLVSAQQQSANNHALAAPAATADESTPKPADAEKYIIGSDDVLAVSVWKEPEISRTVPVRSDGKITLPLIGEMVAGGRTPKAVEAEIRERLKKFMADPEVTVIVQEVRSQTFNVLGEVARPGSYSLAKRVTVLDAIALAGGFRDFAKKKQMYVLRVQANGEQARLPFNYNDVIKGKTPQQNVELQPRDTGVVP
jgi:polysaccharide biosynthesis/export protein